MILVLFLSLAVIVYQIGKQLDQPAPPADLLSGTCPGCAQRVESGWLACPHCQTVLRASCAECGRVHDDWANHCPWCGKADCGVVK